MKKRQISASNVLNEAYKYGSSFSRGMAVEFPQYTMLYISGTASVDEKGDTYKPYDFDAQVERTYLNITKLLESENATWHDVVFTTVYIKDMSDYSKFNDYRTEFFKKNNVFPFPASVCVQSRLCRDDLLVEIEAQAVVEKKENSD